MWPRFHRSGGPRSASEVEQEGGSTYLESVSQNCGDCQCLTAWTGHRLLVKGIASEPSPPSPRLARPLCTCVSHPDKLLDPVSQDWVLVALQADSVDWYNCQEKLELRW